MIIYAVVDFMGEIIHLYTDEKRAEFWKRDDPGARYSVIELRVEKLGSD